MYNKEKSKQYYERNRERILEYYKERNANPELKAKRMEYYKEYNQQPEEIKRRKGYRAGTCIPAGYVLCRKHGSKFQ